jgi:hypothetical protein
MLRIKLCVALGFLLFWSIPTLAQKDALPSNSDLAAITARGRLLYESDQAAWHASDAVMATHPAKGSLGRYIARKTDAGWEVAFGHLNENRDAFLVGVLATEGKSLQEFSVKRFETPQQNTGFYLAAAKGIENALKDFHGADRPYNVAVLPADASQLYVYLMPAQTEDGVYPLGADVRYLISPDGAIVEKRQLHKGIIPTGGPVSAGTTVLAGLHTHFLSDVPEDTDVFCVLTRRPSMPEYIKTKIAVYVVNADGTITVVERTKEHR